MVLVQLHERELIQVALCSRTLTDAEQKYSQNEKESLVEMWACEKFDHFLVGLDSLSLRPDP